VNETALFEMLTNGGLSGAAVDTFENEPYSGPLATVERCLLTAHMGSMSEDCRTRMEIEATQEAVRFLMGQPLIQEVPDEEYDNQRLAAAQWVGING
jgi:D-3-phosphoglycerate dehydrogenase